MGNFAFSVGFLMSHEDPNLSGIIIIDNNGGRSRFGLNERSFPDYWKNGPPTFEDVLMAIRISFWPNLDRFTRKVSAKVLDIRYNCGLVSGNKILQRALSIKDDGIVGDETLKAASKTNETALLVNLSLKQLDYYRTLKEYNIYGHGWFERASDIP